MLGEMLSTVAALSLTMFGPAPARPFNNPPVAVDDSITLLCSRIGQILTPQSNDSDPDGDPLILISASATAGGVSVDGSGTFLEYDVPSSGPATITYTISDGHGGTDTAFVHVTVSRIFGQCEEE